MVEAKVHILYGRMFSIYVVVEMGLQIVNTDIREILLTTYLGMIVEIDGVQGLEYLRLATYYSQIKAR